MDYPCKILLYKDLKFNMIIYNNHQQMFKKYNQYHKIYLAL